MQENNEPISQSILTTLAILDRLSQATTDLLWSSESDYPFEIVTWEHEIDLTAAGLFSDSTDNHALIESISLIDLFAPVIAVEDWYEVEELAQVERYKALLQIIEANLSDVQVFRVGEIEIAIYIVGKTPSGDTVGLKTVSIET